MALKLRWTKRAEKNFHDNLQYLNEQFGLNAAMAFVRQTFAILETIQKYPEIGTVEIKDKNIRGFLITKHNRLFYRFNDVEIIVLQIFDTRTNPNGSIK